MATPKVPRADLNVGGKLQGQPRDFLWRTLEETRHQQTGGERRDGK